jgi:methanogenic corrinoid protein MtbC1
MVYIRSKTVKGIEYAYLVKSEWDTVSQTSRQQTVKYLGRSSDVELDDIPVEYRQDPKILSFLSEHSPANVKKKKVLLDKLRDSLYVSLESGSVDDAIRLYEESKDALSLEDFYDKILRPVMHVIGTKWETKQIDVATEHVCTNTALGLVAVINDRNLQKNKREKVLICTPDGEIHALGAAVIASVLQSKGYRVFNAAPSAHADQILSYIGNLRPDLIMVSITLPENIKAGQRLIHKIESNFDIKILVGGMALVLAKGRFGNAIAQSPQTNSLEDILRLIRSSIRKSSQCIRPE